MHIDEKNLILNLGCIDAGIVPIAGMQIDHVKSTLEKMSDENRRIIVRKFRKILKKAVRYTAKQSTTTQAMYEKKLDYIRKHTGLKQNFQDNLCKKLTQSQRNLRQHLVLHYIDNVYDI